MRTSSRKSWGGNQARGQTVYHEEEICMRMMRDKTKRSMYPIGRSRRVCDEQALDRRVARMMVGRIEVSNPSMIEQRGYLHPFKRRLMPKPRPRNFLHNLDILEMSKAHIKDYFRHLKGNRTKHSQRLHKNNCRQRRAARARDVSNNPKSGQCKELTSFVGFQAYYTRSRWPQ